VCALAVGQREGKDWRLRKLLLGKELLGRQLVARRRRRRRRSLKEEEEEVAQRRRLARRRGQRIEHQKRERQCLVSM